MTVSFLENFAPAPTTQVQHDSPSAGVSQCAEQHDVGEIRLGCVEAELDAVIADLDRASVRAMADGDPQGARLYADRMMAAIRSRTPEHKARLEQEAWQRVNDGAGYFAHQGQLDRERLAAIQGKGAA
jgi:hypothetical protein